MDDVIGLLQRLGFGEYEARAYTALLQRSPLNGYELAKASGIPRANIYAVLTKLEERSAVVRVEDAGSIRYAPVAPTELMRRLDRDVQDILAATEHSLEALAAPADYEYVWSTQGYPVLLQHAAALLEAAGRDLLIALWPAEARRLADALSRAEQRGVTITTLCLAQCPTECGGCRGRIHRYRVAPDEPNRWLVVVPDNSEVLAGEVVSDEAALSVRTRQRLLVELASWYIRHSIALAAVLNDLGERLDETLTPETHAILASIGPVGSIEGWLAHMRHLLTTAQRQASSS